MKKRFLIPAVFFSASVFFAQENDAPIPFTGEEPPAKIFSVSKSAFPHIQSPKIVSPKTAKSEEEAEEIRANNEIWNLYQADLQRYSKIKTYPSKRKTNLERPENLFYKYTVIKDEEKYLDTFNGLYARFQQKQGTLATINRISSPDSLKIGSDLILPVPQGLFVPKNPLSALEILIQKEFAKEITESTEIYEIDGTEFYFLPDKSFSPTHIAFFHDTGMQLPLSKKIVTSQFGYRTSPITGKWKFHAGIDLAAPTGTEVFACKGGKVKTTAYSEIYGNYIVLLHGKSTTSLYAHLSKILVKKDQVVTTGQTIGLVGTTGASTGPHLHFEVRENGNPTDPGKQIKNF